MPAKKRSQNTGTVSAKPPADGRWEARLTRPDGRRKSFNDASWEEAEGKLIAARTQLAEGAFAEPGRAGVADAWAEYVRLNPANLRRSTMKARTSIGKIWIDPVIGHVKLKSLTPTTDMGERFRAQKAPSVSLQCGFWSEPREESRHALQHFHASDAIQHEAPYTMRTHFRKNENASPRMGGILSRRYGVFHWYARQDSNLWPLAPEASALSAELRARIARQYTRNARD